MKLEDYIKLCKEFEGGLSRDKADSASKYPCPTPYKGVTGYHTNKGITYTSWKRKFGTGADNRFFEMNDADWFKIFDEMYFSRVKGHDYKSLNIAAMVTAFAWGSGVKQAGITLQTALRNLGQDVVIDGAIGKKTIDAANQINPPILFDELRRLRIEFFNRIGAPGKKNNKFLRGWLRRANSYVINFRPKE